MNTPCPGENKCPASEIDRQRHQCKQMERFIRSELRRFALSQRQQLIAETIAELSLGWGNRTVKIPKLDMFTELTGITRNNVHSALIQLHTMRIITVEKEGSHPVYKININPDTWQATPRIARLRIRGAKDLIKSLNGLPEGDDPDIRLARQDLHDFLKSTTENIEGEETPENFRNRHDTHFLSSGVLDLRTVLGETQQELEFPFLQ